MLSDMPAYVSAVLSDALVILGHLLWSNFFGYIVDFLVPEYQITQYFLPAHEWWNVLVAALQPQTHIANWNRRLESKDPKQYQSGIASDLKLQILMPLFK